MWRPRTPKELAYLKQMIQQNKGKAKENEIQFNARAMNQKNNNEVHKIPS